MRAWLAASLLLAAPFAIPGVARADLPDEIKVHVEGDPNLVIERRIEDTDLWESVCTGVCDRKLPLFGRYRLLGRGIRESLWIALVPPEKDALKLDVKAGYSTAWAGGITLVALGATAMFSGAVGFIVGASQSHQQFDFPCSFEAPCSDQHANNSVAIAGGMAFIVGAIMVGGGIGAIILGSQTRVRQVTATFTPRGLAVTF